MGTTSNRTVLRDLSLPTRLVLSAFLVAVGLGYFSALVQLHFQSAAAGQLLPTDKEAEKTYFGNQSGTQLERLLEAPVSRPFNGSGSMRPAFTTMSGGWDLVQQYPDRFVNPPKDPPSKLEVLLESGTDDWNRRVHEVMASGRYPDLIEPDERLPFNGDGQMLSAFTTRSGGGWGRRLKKVKTNEQLQKALAEYDALRLVLLEWIRNGADWEDYEMDWYPLERISGPVDPRLPWWAPAKGRQPPPEVRALADQPISADYLVVDQDGHRAVKIKSIFYDRCVRCHVEGKRGPQQYPLESYEQTVYYSVHHEDPRALAHVVEGETLAVGLMTYLIQGPIVPIGVGPILAAAGRDADRKERTATPAVDGALTVVLQQREGERLALVDWIRNGASKEAYERNHYQLSKNLANQPITAEFVGEDSGGRYVKVQSILEARCVRCHSASAGGAPAQYPLDSYEHVHAYLDKDTASGMSLTKLAQTTHVHLLGFSMLFLLTGVIFSMTSYPLYLRAFFAPFTLIAQVADISCWWLGRTDPMLARMIAVTGGLVAAGLMVHVLGSLFNMFGKYGRMIVLGLIVVGAIVVGSLGLTVVKKQLEKETSGQQSAAPASIHRS